MSRYFITQDMDRCIGCLSCEVYCRQNKGLPEEARLCQVSFMGPRRVRGLPREAFVYLGCFHCEHPVCVAACPTGAMRKRPGDGVVYVESELCVGCKACVVACPWGAVQYQTEKQQAIKCDLCKDRLDQGLQPVCVATCTTGCLSLTKVEDEEKISA